MVWAMELVWPPKVEWPEVWGEHFPWWVRIMLWVGSFLRWAGPYLERSAPIISPLLNGLMVAGFVLLVLLLASG